jgi:hypothetical protein
MGEYKIVKPYRRSPKYRVIEIDVDGNERVRTAYSLRRAKEQALIHKMASNSIEITKVVAVASKKLKKVV